MTTRYLAPDWLNRNVVNPIATALVRLGLPAKGARILEVRGRSTGEWRATPVNPLTLDGQRYLVAPRGETQWVRNMRVAGGGRLRSRKHVEDFTAVELDDAGKPPVLRAYLDEWGWEVGKLFEGVDEHADDEQLADIAPGFPVFRITVD